MKKFISYLVATPFAVVIAIIINLWEAIALYELWKWFIWPHFNLWLNYWAAFGLLMIGGLFLPIRDIRDEYLDTNKYYVVAILRPAGVLIAGYVVKRMFL